MNIIIQHNWTTGLGDLYCGATDYLNMLYELRKKESFNAKLIFSINGVSSSNLYIDSIKFDELFDSQLFCNIFDSIEVRNQSTQELNIDNCSYRFSVYGARSPGGHWWDFFSDKPINTNIIVPCYNPYYLAIKERIPLIFPKFCSQAHIKSENFLNKINSPYNFIHIRYFDYAKEDGRLISDMNIIKSKIENSSELFHVGSNNPYVLDRLSTCNNVIIYRVSNIDLFPNDHTYFVHNRSVDHDILLNRLHENIGEMISVINSRKIYYYTSFSWISNFLFYGIAHNKFNAHIASIYDL